MKIHLASVHVLLPTVSPTISGDLPYTYSCVAFFVLFDCLTPGIYGALGVRVIDFMGTTAKCRTTPRRNDNSLYIAARVGTTRSGPARYHD